MLSPTLEFEVLKNYSSNILLSLVSHEVFMNIVNFMYFELIY